MEEKGKPPKGRGKGETRSVDQRKKKSKCSSCKQTGHWHGDPECPNVKSGQDPPRDPGAAASSVNYNASEASPSSRREEESGSARMHRVNWRLTWLTMAGISCRIMTAILRTQAVMDPTKNGILVQWLWQRQPRQSRSLQVPEDDANKVALKTVLEALADDTSDEEVY